MRRREFIRLLGGGAASAWPLVAQAQQPAMSVIGFLNSRSRSSLPHLLPAFRQGLRETGFVEGENLNIEFRWADGQYDKLPALAADLVQRQVAVIAVASTVATTAAKQATQKIPIVFFQGGDPIKLGFVASLHRPGANITGASFLTDELVQKRFEVLHELLPKAAVIGLLVNPSFSTTEEAAKNARRRSSLWDQGCSRRSRGGTRLRARVRGAGSAERPSPPCRPRPLLQQPGENTRRTRGSPRLACDLSVA